MDEKRSVNFTVVPEDDASVPRIYANICSIQHSPFDFTLTFCEMLPMGEREIREAEQSHTVKAPVKARLVVPRPCALGRPAGFHRAAAHHIPLRVPTGRAGQAA